MYYFGIAEYYRPIPELDSWIRRRVRKCCINRGADAVPVFITSSGNNCFHFILSDLVNLFYQIRTFAVGHS
jgi:hypothetical protein